MPTNTTNLSLKKPIVGADEDAWGGYINDNLDDLDDYLSGNAAIPALDVTGTVTSGDLTVDGVVAINTAQSSNATAFSSPHLSLEASAQTDNTGFTGITYATSTAPQYGWSAGAVRGSSGLYSSFEYRSHENSASGELKLKLSNNGDLSLYDSTGTTPKFFWDSSAESLGIGTSSPSSLLHLKGSTSKITLEDSDVTGATCIIQGGGAGNLTLAADPDDAVASSYITFQVDASEAMRITSDGDLLVGKTSSSLATNGIEAKANGALYVTRSSATPASFRRSTTDGSILNFYKDSATVGSIGVSATSGYVTVDSGTGYNVALYNVGNPRYIVGNNTFYPHHDNLRDLGASGNRWDDIYATNATIQTSDEREKQDIRDITEAEARVAQACKGLLKAYRWKDAVAEKGDDARIHFGIIAQDLQAAFAAEGLDAGDYAMFIHTTWADEETGEEKSRMGVRYSELLAFIIAAI